MKIKKTNPFLVSISCLSLALVSSIALSADIKSSKDKISYAFGVNIGQSLKNEGVDINVDVLSRAISDVLAGNKPAMSMDEMQAAVKGYQQEKAKSQKAKGEVAKKAGVEFLAANKKKKGVITLKSGLQYKIVTSGKGEKPKSSDTIVAHYKGTLIDGKVFDSSYDRKQPATFGVGGVIKGWQEILPMMPVGSKWKVFIPSDLAYGERGAGGSIGPGEALVFDIELLEIKKK